jgi:hypothetical protein
MPVSMTQTLVLQVEEHGNGCDSMRCITAIAISHPDQWGFWEWLGQTPRLVQVPKLSYYYYYYYNSTQCARITCLKPLLANERTPCCGARTANCQAVTKLSLRQAD